MDILVTGGAGQVGTALRALAWPDGTRLHAPKRAALDLADPDSVAAALAARPYAAVISAGAYTAVDRAESEVAQAWSVNALAPALLARGTREAGIPLVHVSTDYVFDGTASGPYEPDAPVCPTSVYGASKAAGELAVRSNPRHAILRTAWVVSPYRANFVKTMLRLAGERDGLRVVDDQRGSPTSADDLAETLRTVTLRLARDPGAPSGTYHAVNAGATTWCGLARAVMAGAAARGARAVPVEAIATAEFPTPARRPANSVLSGATLARDHGVAMRSWEAALGEILDALLGRAEGEMRAAGGVRRAVS